MRTGWNRVVPLEDSGRAAGKCGAGMELPAGKVRRRAVGFGPAVIFSGLEREGQLQMRAQRGMEGEVKIIRVGQLVIAGFNFTGAAVIMAGVRPVLLRV